MSQIRYWRVGLWLLLGVVTLACPAPVLQAATQPTAVIRAVAVGQLPEVVVTFQAFDSAGRPLTEVGPADVAVVVDGAEVQLLGIAAEATDAAQPVRAIELAGATTPLSTTVELRAAGAAVGVVFDNTQLLNGRTEGADHRAAGQRVIETLLRQPSRAPGRPEVFRLFMPGTGPEPQPEPAAQTTFTADRATLLNELQEMRPATSATRLYAAVEDAVDATTAAARETGRWPVVVIVADGSDVLSAGAFDAALRRATAEGVRVVAFGVGDAAALTAWRGGRRLAQLAASTGGLYVTHPDETAIADAFRQQLPVAPDAVFVARVRTTLAADAIAHTVAVRVRQSDTVGASEPATFRTTPGSVGLRPLHVSLAQYGVVAVPTALLVALLVALLSGSRSPHSMLSRAITRH